MIPRSILLALALSFAAAACSAPASPSGDAGPASLAAAPTDRAILAPDGEYARYRSDSLTILGAGITGDILTLRVQHGGGCEPHQYRLVVSRIWMESYPVQVPARVVHEANGDLCKALLTREFAVSLIPLRDEYRRAYQTATGRIALRIEGIREGMIYEF
jgi:hypothetical protein